MIAACRQLNHALRSTRSFSTSSARAGFAPVLHLPDGHLDTFRRQCWEPELPAILPRGTFAALPAVTKWFTTHPTEEAERAMNAAYWSTYADTIVPLELTRSAAPGETSNDANADGDSESQRETFTRFHAPLSLFLHWLASYTTSSTSTSTESLYLAQASLSDLPASLNSDLPPPAIVTHAGRGDIYDANIWIGRAPTYTPLHRDPNPNLFVQLAGTKTVRILAPGVGRAVFGEVQARLRGRAGGGGGGGGGASAAFRGEEMMQGPERELLEKVVWQHDEEGGGLEGYEVDVQRGDGLFIPKGWWHSIKGVGSGITGSVNWWFR